MMERGVDFIKLKLLKNYRTNNRKVGFPLTGNRLADNLSHEYEPEDRVS